MQPVKPFFRELIRNSLGKEKGDELIDEYEQIARRRLEDHLRQEDLERIMVINKILVPIIWGSLRCSCSAAKKEPRGGTGE